MSRSPLFLAEKTDSVEQVLQGWRNHAKVSFERPIVLLAALANAKFLPANRRRSETLLDAKFGEASETAIQSFGGICYRCPGVGQAITCGWFDNSAVGAVAACCAKLLRWALAERETTKTPMFVSCGQDEYSSFRLLRLAGENQVVFHSQLWVRLSADAQEICLASNIHEPEFHERMKATRSIGRKVVSSARLSEYFPVKAMTASNS